MWRGTFKALMTPSEHACPRCVVALFRGSVSGSELLACARCGGVWLDADASRLVVQELDVQIRHLAEQFARGTDANVGTGTADIECPICSKPLEQRTIATAGVEMDLCRDHGTWFDRDELGRIASVVAESKSLREAIAAIRAPESAGRQPSLPDGMLDEALDRVSGIFDGLGTTSDPSSSE